MLYRLLCWTSLVGVTGVLIWLNDGPGFPVRLSQLAGLPAVKTSLDFMPHVIVAMGLGALIGFERRLRHKMAGIRTHMVTASAACLVTLCGIYAAGTFGSQVDPTRMAGQFFSGLGFIALVIWNKGETKSGITTASTLLFAVSQGIACGFGFFAMAISSTLLLLCGLTLSYRALPSHELGGHTVMVTCPQAQFNETLALFGDKPNVDSFTPEGDRVRFRVNTNITSPELSTLLIRLAQSPDNNISIVDCTK